MGSPGANCRLGQVCVGPRLPGPYWDAVSLHKHTSKYAPRRCVQRAEGRVLPLRPPLLPRCSGHRLPTLGSLGVPESHAPPAPSGTRKADPCVHGTEEEREAKAAGTARTTKRRRRGAGDAQGLGVARRGRGNDPPSPGRQSPLVAQPAGLVTRRDWLDRRKNAVHAGGGEERADEGWEGRGGTMDLQRRK